MPTSVQVTTGAVTTRPPNSVLAWRAPLFAPRMHSTHCWPTAADRRQSGHAGRPQRTHETYVSRPGCRKQVGTAAAAGSPVRPSGCPEAGASNDVYPDTPGVSPSRSITTDSSTTS